MKKTFETLYARDSKGKILQWTIEVNQTGSQVDIKKSYGEFGGAMALRWQRDIQGKNLGKANATNEFEQAILDAESDIRLKKKKGYSSLTELRQAVTRYTEAKDLLDIAVITDDIKDVPDLLTELEMLVPENRTDASGDVKPMKAQQYYRSKKDWTAPDGTVWQDRKYFYLANPTARKEKGAIITTFPCMAQPKINGVRATIKLIDGKPVIKSKEGNIYRVAHIEQFLVSNPDIIEDEVVLDGELYIHGELLQDIGSAINKPNLNTPRITFVLFDLAIEGTNIERWQLIKDAIKPILDSQLNSPITLIQTIKVTNDVDAQTVTDRFISQGYEGTIFRNFNGAYAFGKRPQDMTKLKRVISREFKIVAIIPQEKDRSKGQFTCITKEGLRFDVNPMGTDAYKKELLRNSHLYIGKSLQCSFYEWTKDLKPFHIIENTVRDYE